MAQHNALTGADLHEPKGIAAQTAGKVYVSNGAGSGAWTANTGEVYPLIHVIKAATTQRVATTLLVDPELSFAVLANSKYLIKMVVFFATGTGSGFKFQIGLPSSVNGATRGALRYTANTAGVQTNTVELPTSILGTTINANSNTPTNAFGFIELDFYLQTNANAGNFSLFWGQNTATGLTQTNIGSWIEYRKVG